VRAAAAATTLAAALALPAAAAAQVAGDVNVTLSPPVAGKAARLSVTATGQATSTGQQPPKSISLFVARGFRVDPRARGEVCTDEQRKALRCPAASRIASGSAEGEATFLLQRFPFRATIEAFLMRRLQPGDVAGVAFALRASGRQSSGRGRLLRVGGSGPFGLELRFDELPSFQVPVGASAQLTRFELTVGANRTVRERRRIKRRAQKKALTRKQRRRKRRRYRIVRVRHDLIRNPATCPGSWPFQLRVAFPSAPEVVRDGSVTCSSR
jgi:hypothetical protein